MRELITIASGLLAIVGFYWAFIEKDKTHTSITHN